ncbi:MAG: LysR family transcriptional regulator [Planctomycetes bacterium]|nr:LysR family transcriptional regulator [Planctomycetota bacterium]
MDIAYLRTFLAVAHERSFSRAAAKVHRTQPAVSQTIRRLEADLGEQIAVVGRHSVHRSDSTKGGARSERSEGRGCSQRLHRRSTGARMTSTQEVTPFTSYEALKMTDRRTPSVRERTSSAAAALVKLTASEKQKRAAVSLQRSLQTL